MIENVIRRLDEHKKYQRQAQIKKGNIKRSIGRKEGAKIKRFIDKRKYYSPYAYLLNNPHVNPDKHLKNELNSNFSMYCKAGFEDVLLPRSGYAITAGQAWGALIKSWKGYKVGVRLQDEERMQKYKALIINYAGLLECTTNPVFDNKVLDIDYCDIDFSTFG
jgi:hypothetical protein